MSIEKEQYEAGRWLGTAREDIDAARVLLESGKFSHACFAAQQAGEKALKAVWFGRGLDPWGHSIQRLINDLPAEDARRRLATLVAQASRLDRYYIAARYPNGLPDLTPGQCFDAQDARSAVDSAVLLLECASEVLRADGSGG